MNSGRYDGKPLLRLLECYVLWAIGKLDQSEEEKLSRMEPALRKALAQEGDWRNIVSRTMELPENMPERIRERWAVNLGIAEQHAVTITPQQFAEMFVDSNIVE